MNFCGAFLDGFKAFYEDELGITVLLWRVLLLSCYTEKNRYRETMRGCCTALAEPEHLTWQESTASDGCSSKHCIEGGSEQRQTLHPCSQDLGTGFFLPAMLCRQQHSHFSGALDAAGGSLHHLPWAGGALVRGPSGDPLSQSWQLLGSGCPCCCQEPAESSLLLLGFPRTSAQSRVAALDRAEQPH